jgi:hypothetical protein
MISSPASTFLAVYCRSFCIYIPFWTCWSLLLFLLLLHSFETAAHTFVTMFTSSLYAVLFLVAVNANVAAARLQGRSATISACATSATAVALDPNALDCFITLPKDPLSATGLSTPFILQPPCSMAVDTQQAFAEAAVYDPATGKISIYHPLVLDLGQNPAAPNVVPVLPSGAVVGIWFGFNGNTLQLLDTDGLDANSSPVLKGANCINGNPGVKGDIFGQVSWCNAEQWFTAANAGIKAGLMTIPPLGNDKNGQICPTSRSFKLVDQDPSDNVPTQYLLVGNATAQDTDANRKALGQGDVINNASDEALLTNILDPLIGCTPFLAPSLDNNGALVPALALSELQASFVQPSPVAFVPLNDPDCLTTADGALSIDKANAYRLGVGQPTVSSSGDADGVLDTYCNNLIAFQPSFLKEFEQEFLGQTSPDSGAANNLFTFLSSRFLASLTLLTCPPPSFQPVVCQMDANNVTTSCVITLSNSATTTSSVSTALSSDTTAALTAAVGTTTDPASSTLSAILAATTSASVVVQVVEVEIVSFFIFVINLGGAFPPSVRKSDGAGNFIVLEEEFVELAPACSRACNHQFSLCSSSAASPHATFAVSDCKSQENNCLGVATTQTSTASTPATLKATATVVHARSSVGAVSASAVTTAAATTTTAAAANKVAADVVDNRQAGTQVADCAPTTVTITSMYYQCTAMMQQTVTATVTVTASASPSLAKRHVDRHARAHRRVVSNFE